MHIITNKNIFYVVVIAVLNLIVSLISGNQGVEAFYSVFLATGLLLTVHLLKLLKFLFISSNWWITKIFGFLFALFVWIVLTAAILVSLIGSDLNQGLETAAVKWWIVLAGTLFFASRISFREKFAVRDLNQSFIGITSSILTIMIFFIAFLQYFSIESSNRSIVLIFAVQFLYISNFVYSETHYVKTVVERINRKADKNSDFTKLVTVTLVGLPFLLPFIVLLTL